MESPCGDAAGDAWKGTGWKGSCAGGQGGAVLLAPGHQVLINYATPVPLGMHEL